VGGWSLASRRARRSGDPHLRRLVNNRRLHGELGDIPPAEFEADYYARTRVGGHEILPSGGHVGARWRPTELPSGGQQNCPR
jgi:hypothetical protein